MKGEKLKQVLAEVLNEEDFSSSEPYYMISGSGWGYYLDPEIHQMVLIPRGTEVIPVEKIEDSSDSNDKILCRSPYRFLLIPRFEVQEIGWN
jgi:hypothetical protein